MNWEAFAAIGELVGAAAVVISLVYLSVQVRQNTAVARASTRQAIADANLSGGSDVLLEPEMAKVLAKDLRGEPLEFHEHVRLQTRAYHGLRHWENIHYQYRAGMLSAEEWQGFRHNLKWLLQTRHFKELWSTQGDFFSPPFRAEVLQLLAEEESEPELHSADPLLHPELYRSTGDAQHQL